MTLLIHPGVQHFQKRLVWIYVKFPVKKIAFLSTKLKKHKPHLAHLPKQIKRDHRQFFFLHFSAAAGQKKKNDKLLAYLRFQLDFYWHTYKKLNFALLRSAF